MVDDQISESFHWRSVERGREEGERVDDKEGAHVEEEGARVEGVGKEGAHVEGVGKEGARVEVVTVEGVGRESMDEEGARVEGVGKEPHQSQTRMMRTLMTRRSRTERWSRWRQTTMWSLMYLTRRR